MVTRIRSEVITELPPLRGITANKARELAHITYRQLDHWARQKWVVPSVDAGAGRSGRRLYSPEDVVRLHLLRHLAVSKVNTATAGPAVARVEIPEDDSLILWGPIPGGNSDEPTFSAVPPKSLLDHLSVGGAWVVFDPRPVRKVAEAAAAAGGESTSTDQRRAVSR